MTTRPTRIAQTSTEAKKAHKLNGPGLNLNSRQHKQLARSADLEERATRERDKERNRKIAKKRREEREKKDREARQRNGVGLATQLVGYSHTQAQLKNGMEAFLGFQKRLDQQKEESRRNEAAMTRSIEAVIEEVVREPWDEEDGGALELPELGTAGGDQWIDDDLDDDTLLEAHDLVMSDPMEDVAEGLQVQNLAPAPVSVPAPVPLPPRRIASKEDIEFMRLHGPINKVLESVLDQLPEPLIELLSQDVSKDPAIWNPAPSLLHKLNPGGLPPHRLRIKVGCAVTLLRDLNSGSQVSRSQHLQVLRMERDRLECLVLDGQLEGTKTFLTRTAFSACHHNDTRFPFQRTQFPIQAAKDFTPVQLSKEILQTTFKMPFTSGKVAPRSTSASTKPSLPLLKSQLTANRNPSFKLPGLPASKANLVKPVPGSMLDGWDDFLESGTQIARELSQDSSSPVRGNRLLLSVTPASTKSTLPPLSTQDFDFSLEDLVESPETGVKLKQGDLPAPPARKPIPPANARVKGLELQPPPPQPARLLHHKPTVPPPHLPTAQNRSLRRKATTNSPARSPSPPRRTIAQLGRQLVPASRATDLAKTKSAMGTFSDFGLSTQEAVSFFDDDDDDDDLAFGTPLQLAV